MKISLPYYDFLSSNMIEIVVHEYVPNIPDQGASLSLESSDKLLPIVHNVPNPVIPVVGQYRT